MSVYAVASLGKAKGLVTRVVSIGVHYSRGVILYRHRIISSEQYVILARHVLTRTNLFGSGCGFYLYGYCRIYVGRLNRSKHDGILSGRSRREVSRFDSVENTLGIYRHAVCGSRKRIIGQRILVFYERGYRIEEQFFIRVNRKLGSGRKLVFARQIIVRIYGGSHRLGSNGLNVHNKRKFFVSVNDFYLSLTAFFAALERYRVLAAHHHYPAVEMELRIFFAVFNKIRLQTCYISQICGNDIV